MKVYPTTDSKPLGPPLSHNRETLQPSIKTDAISAIMRVRKLKALVDCHQHCLIYYQLISYQQQLLLHQCKLCPALDGPFCRHISVALSIGGTFDGAYIPSRRAPSPFRVNVHIFWVEYHYSVLNFSRKYATQKISTSKCSLVVPQTHRLVTTPWSSRNRGSLDDHEHFRRGRWNTGYLVFPIG